MRNIGLPFGSLPAAEIAGSSVNIDIKLRDRSLITGRGVTK